MEQQKKKQIRRPMTEEERLKHNAKMREYNKNPPTIMCTDCDGKYKPYNKRHHITSNKHLDALKRKMAKDDNYFLIKELQNKIEGLEEIVSSFKIEDPDYENEVFDEEVSTEDDDDDWDINSVVASELGKWTDTELNYII
jgi:hypothetical protein